MREYKVKKRVWLSVLLFFIITITGCRQTEEKQIELLDYYTCKVYEYDLTRYSKLLGTSDALGLTGIPTLSEDIGNTGTLTFLAVNPQSEELETTLEYISAFAKYMMTKKDSFLLADEAMYTDTPFMKDWYRMCADGAVYFEMEDEIYWNLFTSYVKGEIELEKMVAEVERKRKIYMGE